VKGSLVFDDDPWDERQDALRLFIVFFFQQSGAHQKTNECMHGLVTGSTTENGSRKSKDAQLGN
jgi:hypothetical protein